MPTSGDDGLGPPSDGDNGDGGANESFHQGKDEQRLHNFFSETSHLRGNEFYVDMTNFQVNHHHDNSRNEI